VQISSGSRRTPPALMLRWTLAITKDPSRHVSLRRPNATRRCGGELE
jgi:hypothetical protein